MATRAEEANARAQREAHRPRPKRAERRATRTDGPAKKRTRIEASAAYVTEDGETPRKSTRRSSNHVKPDSQLRRRAARAVRSPEARAAKAQGRAKRVRARVTPSGR